jgi:hypothetical protein
MVIILLHQYFFLSYILGQYFVLLGATSAMGPLKCLLALGANIIAVDIDRPGVWKKLIEEEVRPSFGSIYFPMKKEQVSLFTTLFLIFIYLIEL